MAFTPLDLPIQEMLQTDFITDLAQIHNSNVLLLKDKLEDVVNNFEFDVNGITIGTGNPINSISSQDIIIQNGGFIFQTGTPNQIISRLSKNGSDESVLNVDHLTVDNDISVDEVTVNNITVNSSMTINGPAVYTDSLQYDSAIVESKEAISVTLKNSTAAPYLNMAIGTITITDTSKRNIYVKLEAETAIGVDQVWTGTTWYNALISDIKLIVDFDATNPPAPNTTFTIHIVDVIENSGQASILNTVNTDQIPVAITAGTNQQGANTILMHHGSGLVIQGQKLAVNYTSTVGSEAMFKSQALLKYGANATFNYIIDQDTADRLIITSAMGIEIY